jgi:hypothetical protein
MSCFNDYIDSERIITRAMAIDQEYENWGKTCPLQFIYQTVTLQEREEEVFSDHYHIYTNVWIATYGIIHALFESSSMKSFSINSVIYTSTTLNPPLFGLTHASSRTKSSHQIYNYVTISVQLFPFT